MKFDNVPNVYIFDNDTKEYKGTVQCDYNPEESKLQGKFVPLLGANETLKPVPELLENQTAIFENNEWTVKADYRWKKQVNISSKFITNVDYLGEIKDGWQLVTDEQADSIQQTPDKWTIKDGLLVERTNEEYSAVQFENAKNQKIYENKEAYDNALKSGVTYKDSLFDCDTLAAVRIMGQLTATQTMAIAEEQTIDWFDYDYKPVTLTISEFLELAGLVTLNTRRIETLNCAFNTAIQNAKTMEELNAILIDYTKTEVINENTTTNDVP